MRNMLIIPEYSGEVIFDIYGTTQDEGIILLQQLYTLLFGTSDEGSYRDAAGNMLAFTEGMNIPQPGAIDSLLVIACDNAVAALDDEDRAKIKSFTATYTYGELLLTLELEDGVVLRGSVKNG